MRGEKNNFLLSIFLIVAMFLILISFVSSNSAGASIGGPVTIVDGNVYYSADESSVAGAKISVACEDRNNVRRTIVKKVVSGEDGSYYVVFNGKLECTQKDFAFVNAVKGELNGVNTGQVNSQRRGHVDVMLMNSPPVVPEFGIIAGAMTILGALCVFFIVRKK